MACQRHEDDMVDTCSRYKMVQNPRWPAGKVGTPNLSYLLSGKWLHLKSASTTILKFSRTQKTVLSSGLFSCISFFFSPQFAAFIILCPFSFPTTFDFCCQCVSWFFFCVRVCLVILGFILFFLLLDLCECS